MRNLEHWKEKQLTNTLERTNVFPRNPLLAPELAPDGVE
jgi:hypothetical protein